MVKFAVKISTFSLQTLLVSLVVCTTVLLFGDGGDGENSSSQTFGDIFQ